MDSHGQPQTFGNATRSSAAGGTTAVTGEIRDIDPQGKARIVTATTGIDHTEQNNATIKLAYDFTPTLKGTYTLGYWQNDSDGSVKSYLKDKATGRTFFNTTAAGATKFVTFDGDPNKYTLSTTGPSHAEAEHWMHGFSLKTNTDGRWDWEAIATIYKQSKDFTRATPQSANSTTNGFDSGEGAIRPSGTFADNKGTGWQTLDLRSDYRPDGDLKSEHQLAFGFHYDRYELKTITTNVSDWLNGATGSTASSSFGKTQTQALYLQDTWKFLPDWTLTPGGRFEHWQAYDGSNFNASNPIGFKQVNYANRQESDFSPKLSLSWQARPDWLLRASYGKAYRYPTVSEMFANASIKTTGGANPTAAQIATFPLPYNAAVTNDPNLKPESVNSVEITGEKLIDNGLWRTSLFVEDKTNALISQTDATTIPGFVISSVQNVDKIRSTGLETSVQFEDLFVHGFDFLGSVTYVDSEIDKNTKNPFTVGKPQPRIPDWRATFVGVYHFNHQLSLSLAGRYSGNQEVNLLYNTVEPQLYGTTVSRYAVFDTKLVYRPTDRWTASVGVNNIGNYKYYVNPNPYPQRQFFASLKFDY